MTRPIDRSTVDRLVVEHLPAALRFAVRLTGDADAAEDVVQEALCRILRRWRTYRGESSFRTWMLQIVLNVERDRRRRWRDVKPLPAQTASETAPLYEQAVADELKTKVRCVIERLPERQREVALLGLGDGLPAGEVAEVLKITEANVHTCLYLARKRIAEALGIDYARPDKS